MAVKIISYKRIFIVNWLDFSDIADLAMILRELEIARRRAGQPLVYISRVVADMKTPDEKLRSEMLQGLPAVLRHCSSVHCILEGHGFSNAVQVSVVSAIIFLMRKRGIFFIHRSMDALASQLHPTLGEEALAAFDQLHAGEPSPSGIDLRSDFAWKRPAMNGNASTARRA
jgi:hypothetical protein